MSAYYQIPWISWRNAVYHRMMANVTGFRYDQIQCDNDHGKQQARTGLPLFFREKTLKDLNLRCGLVACRCSTLSQLRCLDPVTAAALFMPWS